MLSSPLHLIGHFDDPYTGAERELPDLAESLAGRRKTLLWSDVPPHPFYARQKVQAIRAFGGHVPKGGMLLFGGVHVAMDVWLKYVKPERIALRYNLAQHERLYAVIERLRLATGMDPELLFVSHALQLGAGLPGTIERSLIRLEPFLRTPLERPAQPVFTIGRVSRDTTNKHHDDDVPLYKMLAARGYRIRIMGGTCLAPLLEGVQGVELLPAGAMDVADFFAGLDAMFYRTGGFKEAYGRVIFEAMASGLPVVASSVGGYAECITHGKDGFLVRTQEEAVSLLESLATQPDLRRRIGEEGRQQAIRLHGAEAIEAQLQFFLR